MINYSIDRIEYKIVKKSNPYTLVLIQQCNKCQFITIPSFKTINNSNIFCKLCYESTNNRNELPIIAI